MSQFINKIKKNQPNFFISEFLKLSTAMHQPGWEINEPIAKGSMLLSPQLFYVKSHHDRQIVSHYIQLPQHVVGMKIIG